ncbi:MAG: hypothetical protein EXR52_00875 [Dehalococcoidia bacterium]|nr:hypothetical protein [Dehalococcoidia bacterium]
MKVWNVTTPHGITIYDRPLDVGLVRWLTQVARGLEFTVANVPTESYTRPQGFSIPRFAKLYGALRAWVSRWLSGVTNGRT